VRDRDARRGEGEHLARVIRHVIRVERRFQRVERLLEDPGQPVRPVAHDASAESRDRGLVDRLEGLDRRKVGALRAARRRRAHQVDRRLLRGEPPVALAPDRVRGVEEALQGFSIQEVCHYGVAYLALPSW